MKRRTFNMATNMDICDPSLSEEDIPGVIIRPKTVRTQKRGVEILVEVER